MTVADFEVAVVGGNSVGAALALALARAGVKTALVEARPPEPLNRGDGIGLRVSALALSSEKILHALGVWPEIQSLRATPYRKMLVWDEAGSGQISFDCAEFNQPRLGHIVENHLVQTILFSALKAHDNVTLFTPARLQGLNLNAASAGLELDDGSRFTTKLVVGCDGGQSKVRELAGIATSQWNYHQRAVVSHVATADWHKNCCYQRFLSDGPVALLPLEGERSSVVWSTTLEHAGALEALPDAEFCAALDEAAECRLGASSEPGPRASFPLHYLHAKEYVRDRVALIGDAAHVVHPLAGQGANLGFLDAAALAEVIVEARRWRRNFALQSELRRYERARKGDNALMANTLHALKYLFGAQQTTTTFARNLGMDFINDFRPVKKLFMRQATGLAGDLPKLVRGEDL